jgi:hypothetical protein
MTIDFSNLATYIWIVAAILFIIAIFTVIRFFWQHVLKFLIQAGLVILGIVAVLALLHYLRIF